MFHLCVFRDSSTHFDMAMSRPDGVPLDVEYFDYAWNFVPTPLMIRDVCTSP